MNDDKTNPWAEVNEDNYYVSITDMLIGLLFLFIIMLMYFAVQLRQTTETLITAEETRRQLLEKVVTYMSDHNVKAEADYAAGVLRLPDEILFEKGRDAPKPEGVTAIGVLAEALDANLPCYSFRYGAGRPETCGATLHHLEAIFIEGHTDSDPITPNVRLRDNWDLSSARASATYRILTATRSSLTSFLSGDPTDGKSRPIFSVAGYADQRPVARGTDENAKARNRRIDLRFIMAAPAIEATSSTPPPALP